MSLRSLVEDLLTSVEGRSTAFESPPDLAPRQFAAAGLIRCCALLRGVCVLEDGNLTPLTGILERQHWETWLVSLHVLLRGEDAMYEVAGDDIHWKRILSEKLELGLRYHDDWEGKTNKLNFKKLADDLRPLLERAGEKGNPDGAVGYDVTYRVQSLFALHAGLTTIGAYIRYGPQTWGVDLRPPSPFSRPTQTPALHTAHLAGYVFRVFGLATDELDRLAEQILKDVRDSDVPATPSGA